MSEPPRARLVLVHGFTQTRRSWDAVVAHLGDAYAGDDAVVVRVELPGHGAASDRRLDFAATARAIGHDGGVATYVGYSMGGRLCLRLAIDRPELVRSLVLIGASPGLPTAAERDERRRSDARLAADLEAAGTHAFLDRWLAQPLFETTTPSAEELAARRANSAVGLAYALRTLGPGAQEPLWGRLGELAMPVLLVAGEKDAKFRAIAERMAHAIGPTATTAWVEGAGHAVLLDQPEPLARLIAEAAAHAATR